MSFGRRVASLLRLSGPTTGGGGGGSAPASAPTYASFVDPGGTPPAIQGSQAAQMSSIAYNAVTGAWDFTWVPGSAVRANSTSEYPQVPYALEDLLGEDLDLSENDVSFQMVEPSLGAVGDDLGIGIGLFSKTSNSGVGLALIDTSGGLSHRRLAGGSAPGVQTLSTFQALASFASFGIGVGSSFEVNGSIKWRKADGEIRVDAGDFDFGIPEGRPLASKFNVGLFGIHLNPTTIVGPRVQSAKFEFKVIPVGGVG